MAHRSSPPDSDAAPPSVCGACLQALISKVREAAGARVCCAHCSHQGVGTMVRVTVRERRITNWTTIAPVSLEQARAIDRIEAAQGATLNEAPPESKPH